MSDVAKQIADIQRELLALKAGFTSAQSTFDQVVITELDTILPLANVHYRARAEFEYQDYPQLHATITMFTPLPVIYVNPQTRTSLYVWDLGDYTYPNAQAELLLVSFQPPTLFVVEETP